METEQEAAEVEAGEQTSRGFESKTPPRLQRWTTVDRTRLTPLFRHFLSVKDRFPDAVILYQCGDFFETFFDDAVVLHEKLELALTGKEAGKEIGRVPMAGVPLSSLDRCCAALLEHGYNVAVVEQIEPANGRSAGEGALVRREVTRMLTPGTVLEESLLDARSNNYLAAIWGQRLPSGAVTDTAISRETNASVVAKMPHWIFGLAFVDVSTGDFSVTALEGDCEELEAELGRVTPAEILVVDDASNEEFRLLHGMIERALTAIGCRASITRRPSEIFEYTTARSRLEERFGSQLDQQFLGQKLSDIIQLRAAGALLAFVSETLERARAPLAFETGLPRSSPSPSMDMVSERLLTPLQPPRSYQLQACLMLDGTALRNLEIVVNARDGRSRRGTLLWAMDATVTAMGARLLRRWLLRPCRDIEVIRERQRQVQRWQRDHRGRDVVRRLLRSVADLERLAGKVATRRATPRELYSLASSLCRLPVLFALLEADSLASASSEPGDGSSSLLRGSTGDLIALSERVVYEVFITADKETADPEFMNGNQVERKSRTMSPAPATAVPVRLPNAAEDRPIFQRGFNAELDRLREQAAGDLAWIAAYETKERERTGITTLRVGYHSVFGYYIQIPRRFTNPSPGSNGRSLSTLPPDYVRRQTLKSVERYVTPELRAREQMILAARAQVAALECRLFYNLMEKFGAAVSTIRSLAARVAEVDVLLGFAELALERNYTQPEIIDPANERHGRLLEIEDGRHPVVECTLAANQSFVPNSIRLGDGSLDFMLLMGANSSGKSVFLRQTALIQIMAQCGSFVPARRARLAIADRIFTRVGATDDIAAAKSTFVMEMEETATILRHVTPHSLVLLDEVGRGTATADGLAIAQAVTEYLASDAVRARGIFATHFHELAQLEGAIANIACYRMAVIERGLEATEQPTIIFLHRVERGAASKSFGIEVAEQCGLAPAVVKRARELIGGPSHDSGREQATAKEPSATQARRIGRDQTLGGRLRRWRPKNTDDEPDNGVCIGQV
ncbi:hypothetical protein CCYA_CCYA05G1662 [Cyanidiococcus yangmingshanensis]|nr:hypothetical protein CCYA_CCYA05G1662 [Cyanidiococcus yangmingshanensis]